jgi:hypothetical protein
MVTFVKKEGGPMLNTVTFVKKESKSKTTKIVIYECDVSDTIKLTFFTLSLFVLVPLFLCLCFLYSLCFDFSLFLMEPIPITRRDREEGFLARDTQQQPGQACMVPIIGSTHQFKVLVTNNYDEFLDWIMRDNIKTHFYPLPCGFAVSVSNNSLYPDTIHLCGVGEYAVIYQIEKRIPSFARNFLHDNSLFPSTLHLREDQRI